jgi:hypothetical protein
LILTCGLIALAQENSIDDPILEQDPQPEAPPQPVYSPYRQRGSVSPLNGNLLSQMSAERLNTAKISVVFKDYFPTPNYVMAFTGGVSSRMLIGLENQGNETLYLNYFTGSLVDVFIGKEEVPVVTYT